MTRPEMGSQMMIIIDRNELARPADRQSDDELARPEMGSQVTRPGMGSQIE